MSFVIGVDPSITATGIADVFGRLTVAGGAAVMGDRRLPLIADAVEAAVTAGGPDLAVVEDLPTHAHGAGTTGMVQGVIRARLIKLGVPYVLLSPSTLKKYATGNGNANKSDMRMALYKRMSWDEPDDNKVDAWWLRAAGLQALGTPIVKLPAAQVKALDVVDWPQLGAAS